MCKKKFFRVENSMKNGIKDIYLPEENSILCICMYVNKLLLAICMPGLDSYVLESSQK